jgi:tetratricopeptide (TPR) repeat protein
MNESLCVVMPVPENQPSDPVRGYRALLTAEGDSAVVQALLARALYDTGDYTGAVAAADAALRGHPTDGVARITRASALNALCRFEAAAADFAVLAQAHPGRAAILIGLGTAYAEAGQPRKAIAALMQAIAAEPGNAEAAAALGAVCARTGNAAAAITPSRYALTLDPDQVIAHQNLAALLAADDPAVAVHRDAAYRRKQIVTIAGPPQAPVVLVLTCAAAANIPLDHLLPRRRFTQIRWFIDYACPDQDRALPPHDLVFNAIGDPDLMPDLRAPG